MPSDPSEKTVVLALVRDLMFVGRLTATARRLRVDVRVVREPANLDPATAGRLLVLDLDLEGALPAGVAWGAQTGRPVAGFVQHVNTHRIREARAAGVNPVIPRSQLDAVLPSLLVSPEPGGGDDPARPTGVSGNLRAARRAADTP